jgi:tRNA pseudouridine38-40 synthase
VYQVRLVALVYLLSTSNQFILRISYQGTRYNGWQIQPGKVPTIQLEFHKAIEKLFPGHNFKIIASGRTDSGVHAHGQVLSLELAKEMDEVSLLRALNSMLPADIRVRDLVRGSGDFHPIFNADWKIYHYYFSPSENLFFRDIVTTFPFDLDIDLMTQAAQKFVGTYDFKNFQCQGTDVDSTVREIYECTINKVSPGEFGFWEQCDDIYVFKVKGEGFLKQMVRLMVGATVQIGKKKASIADLESALRPTDELLRVGPTAPPQGLFLHQVHYENIDFWA